VGEATSTVGELAEQELHMPTGGSTTARVQLVSRIAIGVAFGAIAFIGIWNAQRYPVALGYDAQGHTAYAHILLHEHRLPSAAETNEAGQPPGYYAVGGLAARLGESIFGWPADSYRGAQYLNLAAVLATAWILLLLAKRVAPGRPSVWAAALLFFAFLPVVSKTAAMFHPEALNMLITTLGVWLATVIAHDRRFTPRRLFLLTAALCAGLLVRASTVFTILAVVAGLGTVVLGQRRGPLPWRKIGVIAASVAAIAVAFLGTSKGRSFFGASLAHAVTSPTHFTAVNGRQNFPRLDLSAMFNKPFRPNYVNEALPETYTEIWGDWIGAFAWSSYSTGPWPPALRILRDQTWIGIMPTALAIAGWLMLVWLAIKRRRELLVLALLPPIAVGGYLYRSLQFLSTDGDLLKASYVLTTAPVWALGFGLAYGSLGRHRLVQSALAVCLLAFAVLELRFMLYGIRDHRPIF
jgi:hypothetical protein